MPRPFTMSIDELGGASRRKDRRAQPGIDPFVCAVPEIKVIYCICNDLVSFTIIPELKRSILNRSKDFFLEEREFFF